MADNTNNIDMQMLQQGIAMMAKATGMNGYGGRSTSSAYDAYKSDNGSSVLNDKEYEKLKNIIKNNGDTVQQVTLMLKNLQKRGKTIDNLYDELNKTTKHLNDTQRRAAIAIADIAAKNNKTSEEAVKSLQKLSKFAADAKKSMEKNKETLADLDKVNLARAELLKKKQERDLKLMAKQQAVASAGSPEEKRRLGRQLSSMKSRYSKANTNTDSSVAALDQQVNELKKAYDSGVRNIRKLNIVTGALTKEELELIKDLKNKSPADREKAGSVFGKVTDAIEGVEKGTSVAADNIVKNSEKFGKGLGFAGKAVKIFGDALLKAIPGLVGDMMARDRYNVQGTDYTGSLMRGISEKERYQLIDQNRIQLRTLGGGNEVTGFGNTKALQNSAHMFGVYGAEAIQKALQYQKTTGQLGISYANVGATQTQMSFMKNLAQQVGETNEALEGFYSSLNDMGQLATMAEASNAKTDKDRQDSVNKEIYQRLTLNKAMGVSVDLLKQQQQQAINARYGGIEQAIRRGIGANMQADQFFANNPNSEFNNANDKALLERGRRFGAASLSPTDQARFNLIDSTMRTDRVKRQANIMANGSDDQRFGVLVNNQVLGNFDSDLQQNDMQAVNTTAQRRAQGKDAIDTTKTFNSTMAEATASMNGPDGFTAAVYQATEVLHGFKGSGNVLGSFATNVASGVAGWFGAKGLQSLGGKLLGRLGGSEAAGGLGKIIGGLGESGGVTRLLGGAGKTLGGLAAPLTAIFGANSAAQDVLDDGGKRFSNFEASLGIDSSKSSGWTDTGAQALNVFSKIGNGLTLGAAGKFGSDPLGWLKSGELASMQLGTGQIGDAWDTISSKMFGFGDDSNTNTPTQTMNAQLQKQLQDSIAAGDTDEAVKLLKEIAKSNKEMNDRDNKNDQEDDAKKAQEMGSAYGQYSDHLKTVINSVTSQ